MIERILRGSFARPVLTILLALTAAAVGAVWLSDLRRDVFPGPVRAGLQRHRPERGDGRRGAGDRRRHPHGAGAGGPARRAAHPLHLAARRGAGDASSSSPTPTTTAAASSSASASTRWPASCRRARTRRWSRASPAGSTRSSSSRSKPSPGAADLMALRDLAEFEVKNRLLAVPGVAAVERLGGYLRQFQVQLDPERMAARGVTLDEVQHALRGRQRQRLRRLRGCRGRWSGRCARWGAPPDVGRPARHRGGGARGTPRCCWGTWPTCARRPPCAAAWRTASGEVVSCRVVKQFGADTVAVSRGVRARGRRSSPAACRAGCGCASSTTSRSWSAPRWAASAGRC